MTPGFTISEPMPADATIASIYEKAERAKESWQTKIWELEQHVRKLENEVDLVKKERDTLLARGCGKVRFCRLSVDFTS